MAREKTQVIWKLRHEYKIRLLIYYSKQFNHPKTDQYAEICCIYVESKGRYGHRRITKELKKKFAINQKTVQKLMRKRRSDFIQFKSSSKFESGNEYA